MTNTVDREIKETEAAADEALIAFLAGPASSADLSDWMRRYPASGADFARAATAQWIGAPIGVPAVASATRDAASEVARTRAVAADALRAFRASRTVTTAVSPAAAPAPLTGLIAAARERGMASATLAETARLPYALLFKLHRRLIAPESVPASCLKALANALDRTVEEIAGYLRQPPTLAMGASYRADAAPQAGPQEDFADALASDPETTDAHRVFHAGDSGVAS